MIICFFAFFFGLSNVATAQQAASHYSRYTEQQAAKAAQEQQGYILMGSSVISVFVGIGMLMYSNMYDSISEIKEKLNQIEQAAQREPPPQQEEEKPVTIQPPPQETEQEPQQEEAPPRPRLIEAPPQTPAGTERAQRKNETPQEETAKQVNHVSTVLLVVLLLIIAIFALLYIINLPHP